MTNARDKLNEAKFFLEEMRRVSGMPDQFRYMLTAFLAASRSVTQIMQKEFSAKTGFSDWYRKKQKEMEDSHILKYLHRQRSITYHERPVLPYLISITGQIANSTGMNIVLTGTGSTLDLTSGFVDMPTIQPTTVVRYYFDDIPSKDKDVITICREARDTLEKILDECEGEFGEI